MAVWLYSTPRRAKTPLQTRRPGRVDFYVCGPTVYDACHVGHARPAVVFDAVRRYLEYAGHTVNFISNITDIDDKIIRRAGELGVPCAQLASRCQDEYERDMARLGTRSPTVRPRATEHIDEMLALAAGLAEKGFAYATPRGLWFDVARFPGYGGLSGRAADDDATEHRVEQDPEKRNPQDFALWKAAKPGEPSWPSPWGPGRPGWHIECSAMAMRYADGELDIHGGGADLAFPHHENEAAQSEAYSGKPLARHWMHNGFITVGGGEGEGGKMGKSKGNAFRLRDAFEIAPPAALRLWVLGTHYRMPLAYRPELLTQNAAALARLSGACAALALAMRAAGPAAPAADGPAAQAAADADARFRAAMDDDFNTPQALASVHELATRANAASTPGSGAGPADLAALAATLFAHMGVLGLPLEPPRTGAGDAKGFVELLLALRGEARAAKDFALSDRIRDGLSALGVEVLDRAGQTDWKMK